ncbi:MAG TPA: hypothetical protein VFR49_07310 [Solirubrobacteraceae bacterium]|nr:hypothetical protein [Solirubrobacteraceae bacterium]
MVDGRGGRSGGTRRPGRSGAVEASRRPRRVRWAAGALLGLWLVGPAAAHSDTDFGTLGIDRSDFGSAVSLRTPSAALFQEADEFVVHRDVVQSLNNDPGLIQAGVYRSGGAISLDNCGPSAGYVVFTEVKAVNSMAYKCQLLNPVAPGSVVTIDLFRFTARAAWGIRVNGVPTGTIYQLGFSRGDPAIGSEIEDLDRTFGTQTATRFAPAGHAHWSVHTTIGRRHFHRVTARDPLFRYPTSDHRWRISRPPGSVLVTHRPA